MIIMITVFTSLLSACNLATSPTIAEVSNTVNTPIQSSNPYPIAQTTTIPENNVYPNPTGSRVSIAPTTTQAYYVSKLTVPTPVSGKVVITGQLTKGIEGDLPYLATLYLGSVLSTTTSDNAISIIFSPQSDLLAIQEINTGSFLFTNVEPGKYGIYIWTPQNNRPLLDINGNIIVISAEADRTINLGNIQIR